MTSKDATFDSFFRHHDVVDNEDMQTFINFLMDDSNKEKQIKKMRVIRQKRKELVSILKTLVYKVNGSEHERVESIHRGGFSVELCPKRDSEVQVLRKARQTLSMLIEVNIRLKKKRDTLKKELIAKDGNAGGDFD